MIYDSLLAYIDNLLWTFMSKSEWLSEWVSEVSEWVSKVWYSRSIKGHFRQKKYHKQRQILKSELERGLYAHKVALCF